MGTTPGADADQVGDEHQFRLMVEAVRDYAIFSLDEQGRVATWNEGARRIKGWEAEEIIGRHYSVFFPPGQSSRAEELLARARRDGRVREEGWRVRRDGESFLAEIVLTTLLDDDGGLRGYVKVTRDVTERRRLELELERSRRMEALGRLAGGVAHDFNNLLTAMLGHAALLESAPELSPPSRRSAAQLLASAEQAARMVDQLLALSRTRATTRRTTRPAAALAGIDRVVGPLLPEAVRLDLDLEDDGTEVMLAPSEVEQIVLNLVLNARDALGDSGGRISVSVHPHAGGTAITVADDGPGMRQEVADRCLEPFFTTKPPSRGSGLGLSIVYGLVDRARGSLAVDSILGAGSTFRISLPTALGSPDAGRAVPESHDGTVLVVDDDESVAGMAVASLERAGRSVVAVTSGRAALELLEEDPDRFAWLVTDLVMPEMSGDELLAEVRERWPDIPCVAVTGYAEADLPHGVGLLRKPFTPEQLVAALETLAGEP